MGDREDLCGRTVGEFVLRERIDEGGFGAVYRCEQPLLGREAVVKVLHQRLRRNDVVLQRFMREAQLASRLDHPYAAHVYAFGIEHADGLFWIAMEMVQGTTLNRWLRERGSLPLDQFVPFFERVAEVVQTAHERGIVHRDLKPSNVMVIERAGRLLPKLLDFGVAKLLDSATLPEATPESLKRRDALLDDPSEITKVLDGNPSEAATLTGSAGPMIRNSARLRLTQDDATVGSPPYMSPEQWNNAGAVGPASDLYALAVVAYEALSGRRPFSGATLADYVELHCNGAVPPLGGNFPPALDRMFQKALAKKPEERWGTALELAAALRAASGVGTSWADLPKLDESVRDAWLADAPQPLAESIAALDGARNAHQARDSAEDLVRNLLRYLLAIALATHAQVRADRSDPALLELVRTMRRRDLGERERVRLLRLLVRPLTSRRGAHPIPELVDLVTTRADGTDGLDPILALHATTDHAGTEDVVRSRLGRLIPELTQLLRRCAFVLDYVLVVPRNHAAERWAGLRRQHRALATVFDGELVKDHPMLLDREGRICVDLWPLMQTVSPTDGAEPELFLFDGRGRHGALLIAAPAGFEHHDPSVWEWIAARVIAEADNNPELSGDDQPPYLGLTSYNTTDAGRFVGREAEVDAFLNRLRQRSLQVVVGPSGAGKSSFVHAGVVPNLPSSWRTVTVRPGGAPLTALASRLAASNITSSDLRPLLESSPAAAALHVAHAALSGTVVIVIDQLEELFTLCTSADERNQFASAIAQLAGSADASIRVICAIRDDFLMNLEALSPLRPLLSPSLYLLGNPSRDTLVRIVTEPAKRAGYALSDPELAQDMVDAVADRPGALALLSFAASRLWELRDRRFRQLTRRSYDGMGGIGGALGRHAEAILEKLSADEQRLTRDIFRHLVTAEGTRAPLSLAELRQRLATPRAEALIDKLVSARLITVSELDGESNIEVIHDSLIAAWPRLQGWIREDVDGARMRDQIRAAALQWEERGRARGLLWRDEVLADLERWLRRAEAVTLSDREAEFLDASRRAAAGAKRLRRGLLFAGFAIVVLFAAFQYRSASQIREAKSRADELLTDSYVEQGRNSLLAGKYAEATAYFNHAVSRGSQASNLHMMLAVASQPLLAVRQRLSTAPSRINSVKYTPDGRYILTTDDHAARVWDAHAGAPVFELPHVGGVYDVQVLPGGGVLASAGADGAVRTWNLVTGRPLLELRHDVSQRQVQYRNITVSPDGAAIAAIELQGDLVHVWDANSGEFLVELSTTSSPSRRRAALSFSSNGAWLVASGGTDVQVFETQTWKAVSTLTVPQLSSLSFDPTGTRLITSSFVGDVTIWELPSGKRLHVLQHAGEKVYQAAISPDGELIATTGQEGLQRVWSAKSGEFLVKLVGREAGEPWVEFDRTSRFLVSSGAVLTVSDAYTGLPVSILASGKATITNATFDATGHHIAGVVDGQVLIWDASTPYRRWSSPTSNRDCSTLVNFDDDARFMAIGCSDSKTYVWDTTQGQLLATLPGATTPEGDLVFRSHAVISSDGSLAAITHGANVDVYELPGNHLLRSIHHPDKANVVSFFSGSHTVISASIDGTLLLTAEGQPPRLLRSISDSVDVLTTTQDRRIVVASTKGRLIIFDPNSTSRGVDSSLDMRVASVRLSATGHRMLLIPSPGKLAAPLLWDLDNNRVVAKLDNHKGRLASGRFVVSDRQILTTGGDGVTRRWDSSTGRPLKSYVDGSVPQIDAILTPDGSILITAGADGMLRFWDVTTASHLWTIRAHKGVNGLHYEGDQLITRSLSGEFARWVFPLRLPEPELQRIATCAPTRFDEGTSALVEQAGCNRQ